MIGIPSTPEGIHGKRGCTWDKEKTREQKVPELRVTVMKSCVEEGGEGRI